MVHLVRPSFLLFSLCFLLLNTAYAMPTEYTRSQYNQYFELGVTGAEVDGDGFSDDTTLYNLSWGFRTSENARAELQYTRTTTDSEIRKGFTIVNAELEFNGLLVNWAYDYYVQPKLFIFGEAGLGGGYVDYDVPSVDGDYVFLYQFNAGLGYNISSSWTGILSYRGLFTNNLDVDDVQEFDIDFQGFDIALQYTF